jgi:hypothetical protein
MKLESSTEMTADEIENEVKETENGFTGGYTSQYIPVLVRGEHPHGEALRIMMSEYRDHQMYGEIIL